MLGPFRLCKEVVSLKAYLVLADGSVFEGKAFGYPKNTIGELVFNTSMTGYQEVLSDTSYFGQIVTMTYPLIGNYGCNSFDDESQKPQLLGFVVRTFCNEPSNFRMDITIDEYLKKHEIPGIYDIDTRQITKIVRNYGAMNAGIVYGEFSLNELLGQINNYKIQKAVRSVTCQSPYVVFSKNRKYKIGLFDYGSKRNIINSLVERGCEVTVLPAYTKARDVLNMGFDGIMLSNGPGDPAECVEIIEELKVIAQSNIPIFGICLGHQLLALSQGGKREKLKFGHHGANHPVMDLATKKAYITSQNHNYAIVAGSLDESRAKVTHISLNDHTVEGIEYKNINAFTVQFHPEACAGPQDTGFLFDKFMERIKAYAEKK